MNVQTLPPGYKVAPWTPPEKIDSKMLADASAKLIDLLRIRTQPIGMRLFEDPADMEKIQGVRKPTDGFKFTMCQMVTQSRWYGFTLGITVDNTRGGNCGGVVGLNHPGEGFLSGDHMNGVWFGNKEASAAHQAQMPRVPDGKYNGLVVSPLRSARLDPPDICLFYGTPGQMIYFINGLQFHRYRRYDFTCTGESACAEFLGTRIGHAADLAVAALLCRAALRRRRRRRAPDGLPARRVPARHRGHGPSRQERPALSVPALWRGDGSRLRHGQELRLMLYVVAWPVLAEADDTALRRLRAQYHPREADLIGPHFTLVFGASKSEEAAAAGGARRARRAPAVLVRAGAAGAP